MKTLIILALNLLLVYSCTKEPSDLPCDGPKVICWHNVPNSWKSCPNPNTGVLETVLTGSWLTVDSVSVCDTTQWLNLTRQHDIEWININTTGDSLLQELKKKYPPSCGCY